MRYVKFPGVIQIIDNLSIGMTLILRTYALYNRKLWVFLALLPFYLGSTALEIWAVSGGVPVPLPPPLSGCILTGRKSDGKRFAGLWIGQLVFPSIVFALTLGRILKLRGQGKMHGGITELMLRDGTMYFFVILIINMMNVITYSVAPTDLQAINASLSSILQAMMICRLMLNLRGGVSDTVIMSRASRYDHSLLTGNLGADVDIHDEDWRTPTQASFNSQSSPRPSKRDGSLATAWNDESKEVVVVDEEHEMRDVYAAI